MVFLHFSLYLLIASSLYLNSKRRHPFAHSTELMLPFQPFPTIALVSHLPRDQFQPFQRGLMQQRIFSVRWSGRSTEHPAACSLVAFSCPARGRRTSIAAFHSGQSRTSTAVLICSVVAFLNDHVWNDRILYLLQR